MQMKQCASEMEATIEYYEKNARAFSSDTANADMSATLSKFVSLLPAAASVLDWGCGTGRDSRAMLDMGLVVTSTDASPAMCHMAKDLFNVDARCEGFDDLNAKGSYDGIWACASLLHVRKDDLPSVFKKAHDSLKPNGVFYTSFKCGDFEGMRGGRWFTDLEESTLVALLQPFFDVISVWESEDVRPGRGNEKWLNCLARKLS